MSIEVLVNVVEKQGGELAWWKLPSGKDSAPGCNTYAMKL